MSLDQDMLAERIRALITDEPAVREVSMFGGRCVMVNDKMIASALKDGGLLVRVAAERHDELLGWPGAARAEMGQGRAVGPGWIKVAADAVADGSQLASWIAIALEHNRSAAGRRSPGRTSGTRPAASTAEHHRQAAQIADAAANTDDMDFVEAISDDWTD